MKVTILIFPLYLWLVTGLCCVSARAQTAPVHSFTGQFSARFRQPPAFLPAQVHPTQMPMAGGWAYLLPSRATPALGNGDEVNLEPSMLVVSCEQVKSLLLERLGLADRWRGRIDLTINPAWAEGQEPQLRAEFGPRGWTYKLELPRRVQGEILMRWLIQTMLLEIANRQAGVESAEIPLWLVEGLSADLQSHNLPTLIHQPGQNWSMDVKWNMTEQMMPLILRQRAPLSFQQLSWPQASDLAPAGLPLFRGCAQFFLEELLRLNDGRACLRSMIEQLPEHWNWQTAFLRAFHSHFEQLLDVEKWWSVSYLDFVKEYKGQVWSDTDCRQTLQRSLDVPVAVHFGPDQLPVEARITLQEAICKWPAQDVHDAMERAVEGLQFLAPRATPTWRPLVKLYLKTLLNYISDSKTAEMTRQYGKHPPPLLSAVKALAINELDDLDRQREALWPGAVSTHLPPFNLAKKQNNAH